MPYSPKPCKLEKPYISFEEEVRCLVMNALVGRNAKVWDCRPSLCNDPIWIEGLMVEIRAGDIPFSWKGELGICELKFLKVMPSSRTARPSLFLKGFGLRNLQHEFMKRGRGVLVLVAEPTPKFLDWYDPILTDGVDAWYQEVKKRIRIPLSHSEIPYHCVILNRNGYDYFYKNYFRNKGNDIFQDRDSVTVSMDKLLRLLPSAEYSYTLHELRDGVIADQILKLFELAIK